MKRAREHDMQQPDPKRLKFSTAIEGIYAFGQNVIGALFQWWNLANPVHQLPLQIDAVSEDKNLEADIQEPLSINLSLDTDILSEEKSQLVIEEIIENLDIVITEERNKLLRERLFLTEQENSELYVQANKLFAKFESDILKYNEIIASGEKLKIKKPKHIHQPTIQLSHDGIALLFHLYAQKDNSPKQPLVVKTFDGFKNILTLVDNSPNDISLPLVVQFDEEYSSSLGDDNHRIAIKLEKINSEIHVVFLDSIVDSQTKLFCILTLENTLKHTQVHLYHESQKNRRKRQNDEFQCTVFSIKDARQLNKENPLAFSKHSTLAYTNKNSTNYTYILPPTYLKGIQSRTYQSVALQKSGNAVVSNKGHPLKEVYEKHPNQSYIPHFSKKYETLVMTCANSLTDAQLDEAIGNYRAETITPERLQAVYGNKTVMKKA